MSMVTLSLICAYRRSALKRIPGTQYSMIGLVICRNTANVGTKRYTSCRPGYVLSAKTIGMSSPTRKPCSPTCKSPMQTTLRPTSFKQFRGKAGHNCQGHRMNALCVVTKLRSWSYPDISIPENVRKGRFERRTAKAPERPLK